MSWFLRWCSYQASFANLITRELMALTLIISYCLKVEMNSLYYDGLLEEVMTHEVIENFLNAYLSLLTKSTSLPTVLHKLLIFDTVSKFFGFLAWIIWYSANEKCIITKVPIRVTFWIDSYQHYCTLYRYILNTFWFLLTDSYTPLLLL